MIRWQQHQTLSTEKIDSSQYPLDNINRQRAWIEIDLNALAHNVKEIKSLLAPQTALMAVVKADAYGHGAEIVAKTVLEHGADWLAVATIAEV